MPFVECHEVGEWIEEEISRPIEEFIEREEERCRSRRCNWWCLCCNKWFCWLVTVIVRVVHWIVETVVKWVVRIICEVVNAIVGLIIDFVEGLRDIFYGIFTGDWGRVQEGLVQLVAGIIGAVASLGRTITLGSTFNFIREEVNRSRLRDYVRASLAQSGNSEDEIEAIREALGVDHGAFGYRMAARAIRTFVRSDAIEAGSDVPLLIQWHEAPDLDLNLRELAGFELDTFITERRFRPELVADDGHAMNLDDLNLYIESRGAEGRPFTLYAMSLPVLQHKLEIAEQKARLLGLMLQWRIEDIEVRQPEYVRLTSHTRIDSIVNLEHFLTEVAGRALWGVDPDEALAQDLCTPTAAGVFAFVETDEREGRLNGLSMHLRTTTCPDGEEFHGGVASGVVFHDRLPDFVWQYVLIHELGHYFGLCHADGLDRVMYGALDSDSWFTWTTLFEYLYLSGGPVFTYDEATRVWDYIVEHFPVGCLIQRIG